MHSCQAYITELKRPWKLATLAIGTGLLIAGSFYMPDPDWDIPISLIMAFFSSLFTAWGLRVVLSRAWRWSPLMLPVTWFAVDGCYAIYWYFKNPIALEMKRDTNFLASFSLYGMCGLAWLYQGTLRELWARVTTYREK